jgi:hypothetical protein
MWWVGPKDVPSRGISLFHASRLGAIIRPTSSGRSVSVNLPWSNAQSFESLAPPSYRYTSDFILLIFFICFVPFSPFRGYPRRILASVVHPQVTLEESFCG